VTSTPSRNDWIWLLLSLVAAVSMSFYVLQIWSAGQPEHFSDLYARWWGAHELFLHGRDPYSPAVSHEIQTVIYGSASKPSPDDPDGIGGGFAYPLYTSFLLWPTIHLSFPTAEKIFLALSIAITVLSVVLWMRSVEIRPTPVRWIALLLLVFGSFPTLQGLKLVNLSLLAAGLIAVGISLVRSQRLIAAGIVLASATFKPQFVIVIVPILFLWIWGNWTRRRSLAWSFFATLLLLFGSSEFLLPGWIHSFLGVARAYQHYTFGHSLLDLWFTPAFGPVAAAVLILAVFALCWRWRSQEADSPQFLVGISLALAATVVVIPTLAPHAQLLLLPGVLYLWKNWKDFRKLPRIARLLSIATAALLAWPWLGAFGLMSLAAVGYPTGRLLRYWEVPLATSPVLPLAMLLCLGATVGPLLRPTERVIPGRNQAEAPT